MTYFPVAWEKGTLVFAVGFKAVVATIRRDVGRGMPVHPLACAVVQGNHHLPIFLPLNISLHRYLFQRHIFHILQEVASR